ncbi:right-handed parallel beta-helix repeat-containing protein [Candidatus Micrarchaeota archaeon]|nr:right-handed parallel beta-helix repeat-containing protein [Candidatus Micrarchaeota archaeon]
MHFRYLVYSLFALLLVLSVSFSTGVSGCTVLTADSWTLSSSIGGLSLPPNSNPAPYDGFTSCLLINESNVLLDCQDNWINGSGTPGDGNSIGIMIGSASTPLTNVTVRNCNVGNYSYGIISRSLNSDTAPFIITNNNFTNMTNVSIVFEYANGTLSYNNITGSLIDGTGLIMNVTTNSNFTYNNVSGSSTYTTGTSSSITNNLYTAGTVTNLASSTGGSFTGNTVAYSGVATNIIDVYSVSYMTISYNNISGNSLLSGIVFDTSSMWINVTSNNVSGPSVGFKVPYGSASNITFVNNDFAYNQVALELDDSANSDSVDGINASYNRFVNVNYSINISFATRTHFAYNNITPASTFGGFSVVINRSNYTTILANNFSSYGSGVQSTTSSNNLNVTLNNFISIPTSNGVQVNSPYTNVTYNTVNLVSDGYAALGGSGSGNYFIGNNVSNGAVSGRAFGFNNNGQNNVSVINNTLTNFAQYAVLCNACQDFTFSGNTINNASVGLNFTYARKPTVTSNTISNATTGIYMQGVNYSNVRYNVINSPAAGTGLRFTDLIANQGYVNFTNNNVTSGSYGARVDSLQFANFSNNLVTGVDAVGFYLTGFDYSDVSNNIVLNSLVGVQTYGILQTILSNNVTNSTTAYQLGSSANTGNVSGNIAYQATDCYWFNGISAGGLQVTSNTATHCTRGFNATFVNYTVFSTNTLTNASTGLFFGAGHDNNLTSNVLTTGSIGLSLYNSSNVTITNDHYSNYTRGLFVNNTANGNQTVTVSGLSLDSPGADLVTYLNVSMTDIVNSSTSYDLSYVTSPGLPSGYNSFVNKYLNFTNYTAGVSLDAPIFRWTAAEGALYPESSLLPYLYTTANASWAAFSPYTLTAASHNMNFTSFSAPGVYAILYAGAASSPTTGSGDTSGSGSGSYTVSYMPSCVENVVTLSRSGARSAGIELFIETPTGLAIVSGSTNSSGQFGYVSTSPSSIYVRVTGVATAFGPYSGPTGCVVPTNTTTVVVPPVVPTPEPAPTVTPPSTPVVTPTPAPTVTPTPTTPVRNTTRPTTPSTPSAPPTGNAGASASSSGGSNMLMYLVGLLVLVAIVVGGYLYMRSRTTARK